MDNNEIRTRLINNGVKNMQDFGYPNVNQDNILTDLVYAMFFKRQLRDNKGEIPVVDIVIDQLISEIDTNLEKFD